MASFSKFGNDLYTGDVSINFIGRRKVWYTLAAVLLAVSIVVPALRGGYVFGIEFTGGSQFQIDSVEQLSDPDVNAEAQTLATDTVIDVVAEADPKVTVVGTNSLRIQTEQLETDESNAVRDALANAFDVENDLVAASFVGPSWGADITSSALRALIVFIALAAIMMAIYFRTWKMSIAAMIALLHDIVITAGVYGVFGFEITPSAVIGFLTILGFSLYDTVVVFDKIRENTSEDGSESRRTFAESVNLAVNQTLVRSINTGVVAALPVAAILFIGAYVLGAGTLRDIALALFIGIVVGTYSTIFIAAPLYAQFRQNEPAILSRTKRLTAARAADKGGK
ncbi:protein translocase subunit SecF [Salinibacterium sp. NSLL150]|uniref:protein translocase subunit SecF n=1 Tax=unclassified Salinibacterium TaxID=2632331 RepID=UPI0018CFCE6F|nr:MULTISPECIES: protein translocase subunit SecF [unclassified Salinibacterium]MBH0024080.1 protein translocase subunit SecF [Salinibacterium sp. SWN248]MBH0099045.1 protein translocase subunit SecF [Salinibacterium sp. NSLL35]MBH0101799.1 protein translocase subunit SecF [Salinibacterium sp. NSLL150]MBH0104559.1 protein translocase subunit SecF [Salinibacterium sp. NSLL16]MBH0107319.1 protein translocase subunit SecF [Salinibacterium sp. NSLL17]